MAATKCRGVCNSTEHAECGFCSSCGEHAASYYDCAACGDVADETPCPKGGHHQPDDTTEDLTVCCGAKIRGYDAEPPDNDDAWSGGFARNH